MIFVNCQQGTPEWFAARSGVITASMFSTACDYLKNGQPSQSNKDYGYRVAVEQIHGATTEDTYQTWEMRRGQELEPLARIAYESRTGNMADEAGIVLTDDRMFGYSTDGFVDDDGMIEIKAPNSSRKIFDLWTTRDFSEYIHQVQGGLWITGRKWCDLCVYTPYLESINKVQRIHRFTRDDDFIETMEAQLMQFAKRVQQHIEALKESA